MDNREIKVLTIDDNRDNLISLKALIHEAFSDYTVLTAQSGSIGYELADREDPDVILLDIVMPGMDGFELCRKLKANNRLCDIPVVFVTAIKGDRDNRIQALKCGAEAFLAKPIDEFELTAQIQAMVKIKTASLEKRNEHERLEKIVEEKTRELKRAHSRTLKLIETIRKENETLLYMSYHDQLTGLKNRRYFEEEMVRCDTRSNLPISIIMGDLNGLKLINDSLGHESGDILLSKAAIVMKMGCRKGDLVARIGGDEFVALLLNTDTDTASSVVSKIKRIASSDNTYTSLSISFGIASKTDTEQNILGVLASAENDMYSHKLYENDSMRSKTINMIMNTLFEKSDRELLHSKRVSELCEAIAGKIKMSEDDVKQVKIAGLLHDIGKIGVNEKILNKKGRLTEDEWKEIRKHPEGGWRILNTVSEFSELACFVLEHHERWDGTGYPKGLKGKKISLQARIIAIADAYDAMTSQRSYRKGISDEEAMSEIRNQAGLQFDPNIAEIFIEKVFNEKVV